MTRHRRMFVASGRSQARELNPGLIEACRSGDREAFRSLFEAYKDSVYAIALNFSGNRAAAEDISQDVFLKLFAAIQHFRGSSKFGTWLFRLVVNACMDEHRRKRRLVPMDSEVIVEKVQSAVSQEQVAWHKELAMHVQSAVAALAPKLRLPILLRYVEGFSYEEIAEVLGCSSGTVASRLNRGHKILARRLSHLRGAMGGGDV